MEVFFSRPRRGSAKSCSNTFPPGLTKVLWHCDMWKGISVRKLCHVGCVDLNDDLIFQC